MTVADKVRSMTDKQLARFIMKCKWDKLEKIWCIRLCPDKKDGDCECPYGEYETILGYLQAEEALAKMGGK